MCLYLVAFDLAEVEIINQIKNKKVPVKTHISWHHVIEPEVDEMLLKSRISVDLSFDPTLV